MQANVLAAIESERAYQEAKWHGHRHTLGEWLLILEKQLGDAKRAWLTAEEFNDRTLDELRQLTAVGVAAMEQCGAPLRVR